MERRNILLWTIKIVKDISEDTSEQSMSGVDLEMDHYGIRYKWTR